MAIEYVFGTTAALSTGDLQKLFTDSMDAADNIETPSTDELWLMYEEQMTVYCHPATFSPDSPGQTHWKRILGSRPQIVIIFRFMNGADAAQNHIDMISFIAEFLSHFRDDAVFYPSTSGSALLLRYKGKIAVNADDTFWAKQFERLDQAYALVSNPKPDGGDTAN